VFLFDPGQLHGLAKPGPFLGEVAQGIFLVKEKKHSKIPSGYVKIAIENDHRNSGFSH